MSEKYTTIHLPGLPSGAGWMEHGDVPAGELIASYRRNAQRDLEHAQAILAAADEDFRIETAYGVYVQKKRHIIQPGRTV